MKVNREKLLAALNQVKPGLANKDIISQSTSFVFSEGFVITFNDEISIATNLDIGFEGAVIAEKFLKLLTKLTTEEIEIEVKNNELVVKSGKDKAGLKIETDITLPIDEVVAGTKFKSLPKNFSKAVFLASQCASKDMSNPIRTCVKVDGKCVLATDNYRIMKSILDSKVEDEIIMPANAARFFSDYSFVNYNLTNGWVHFQTQDGLIFSVRLVYGNYPSVDEFFEVTGEELLFPNNIVEILEKSGVFTAGSQSGDFVNISVANKKMTITGNGDHGWYEGFANCRYNGEEIKFCVDPSFLVDVLKDLKKCTISDTSLLFEGDGFHHLVALVA